MENGNLLLMILAMIRVCPLQLYQNVVDGLKRLKVSKTKKISITLKSKLWRNSSMKKCSTHRSWHHQQS